MKGGNGNYGSEFQILAQFQHLDFLDILTGFFFFFVTGMKLHEKHNSRWYISLNISILLEIIFFEGIICSKSLKSICLCEL